MSRVRLAALAVLALAAFGCSSGTPEGAKPRPEIDARQLRRLELTYEIPAQVRQACAEARRLASVRVICPPLIPDVPLTRIEGLWGAIVVDPEPRFYMLSFNNGGLPGGRRHWIIGGGKASVVEKWVLTDFQNAVKGDPRLVRTLTVRGRRVSIYHFPPFPAGGPNGGQGSLRPRRRRGCLRLAPRGALRGRGRRDGRRSRGASRRPLAHAPKGGKRGGARRTEPLPDWSRSMPPPHRGRPASRSYFPLSAPGHRLIHPPGGGSLQGFTP